MVCSILNLANFFFTEYLLTLSSQITCCVVATMKNHVQARLGDLNAGSIIARFQALDHTLWPPIGESRESKTAFIVHGNADVTALWTHYDTRNATAEPLVFRLMLFVYVLSDTHVVNLRALEELSKMATPTFILFRGSKRILIREGDMNTGKTCILHHTIFAYG